MVKSSGKRLKGILRDSRANLDFTDEESNIDSVPELEKAHINLELEKPEQQSWLWILSDFIEEAESRLLNYT